MSRPAIHRRSRGLSAMHGLAFALRNLLRDLKSGELAVLILAALAMALLTACSYAELVTKYPHAGGSAVFARRAYRSPLVAFLVAGLTDLFDGLIARMAGQKTTLGAWLDPMADKLLLVTMFIMLTLPDLGSANRLPPPLH